ncbi:probable 28S ribosomal protein S26, mitochondrial [Condylostylus longicornis]|uniref:probable 28S ribosomal protein S26, mitochondrial n=1 Tax=Condylostylus longicornis TaxID=2530218 RepID=UPI00244DCBB9|nr:probable 28S ribosomal protein S26, mitochondrial [Condylostylus longicornis]
MLRYLIINKTIQNLENNLLGVQFLRWRRKPRWLPVAKSKEFRIPERPKQSEEEKLELMRLHNQYRTQMRSVRSYLIKEWEANKQKTTSDHVYITPEEAEKEFQMRMQLNNEWNKTISIEREEKLRIELKAKEELIKNKLENAEYYIERKREQAREEVLEQIELAKTFITRENLEAKIEEILANPVNHNFCVDLEKNIHREMDKN